MKKTLIPILLVLLFFSCRTGPSFSSGELLSRVDNQSDPYLFLDAISQRELVLSLFKKVYGEDPQLVDLLQDCRWIAAGESPQGLRLQLFGLFPMGKIKLGLNTSPEWEKREKNNYYNSLLDMSLNLIDGREILLYSGSEIGEETFTQSLTGQNGESYGALLALRQQTLEEVRKQSPMLKDTLQTLEFHLFNSSEGEYILDILFIGISGEERALSSTGRIFLLSLIGRKVMDALESSSEGVVSFRGIGLTHEEWTALAAELIEGVEL